MLNPFQYHEEVHKEFDTASERAAAVIAAAFLDEILQELLLAFFVSDAAHDKKLFEGNGPLSTFSSKIDLCYRLGLISRDEYRVMHIVRSIRNEFAHKLGGVAFSIQSIADKCKSISTPRRMVTPKDIPFSTDGKPVPLPRIEKASENDPRALFEETIFHLMNVLSARCCEALESKRTESPEYKTAEEPREVMILHLESLSSRYERLLKEAKEIGAPTPEIDSKTLKKNRVLIEAVRYCIARVREAHANDQRTGTRDTSLDRG